MLRIILSKSKTQEFHSPVIFPDEEEQNWEMIISVGHFNAELYLICNFPCNFNFELIISEHLKARSKPWFRDWVNDFLQKLQSLYT